MGIIGRAKTLLTTALSVAATVVACAAPDEGVEVQVEVAPQTERFGVIALTYSEEEPVADEALPHDRLVSQAYFVESRGVDRAEVLRLLSSPLDGLVDPEIPVDACIVEQREVAATSPVTDGDDGASVRLLDAGELMLDTGGGTSMLDSHYFPEMYSAVGGIAYDGLVYDSHAFGFDRPLTITADGSDEVGELTVTIDPPEIIHLHSVGGAPTRHARAWLPDDGGLEVTWLAGDDRRGDRVAVLRYVRRGFDHMARVTCVADDDGAFTIPEAALALLPDLGADQTDRVVIERVHASPFSGPGMPEGVAVAIASDAIVLE